MSVLLGVRRQIIWNVARTIGEHSRLKLLLIFFLGGGIWCGLYLFPYYGFQWVVQVLHEGSISDVLVSLFFFLLMIMLVFSNAVIAYTALFRSKEAWFLHGMPLRAGTLFLYKLLESLAFSSWAFFLLGMPIMLAYGVHKGAPWYYYGAIPVYFGGFVLIPASLGALIALILSMILRPWMRRVVVWLAVVVVIGATIAGSVFVRKARPSAFFAPVLLQRMNFSHSVYLPSAWVSRGLAICAGTPGPEAMGDALYYLGLLASNSFFFCFVAYALANRCYYGAWDAIHSLSPGIRSRAIAARLSDRSRGGPMFHLIVKDMKTFVRDPVQWTQCAVLFGLLGLYILNLRNLHYPGGEPVWRHLTTFLNLASICLVLATLTTRFVFPMFSLEGGRFWLLGLVPVKRSYVLWSKLVFSLIASLSVTELLMILSDLILDEPLHMMVLHVLTVGLVSVGLSGLAVGLSALYPNLGETSPAKIVSGFGGTLNLILSLLFVSVVVAVEAAAIFLWSAGRGPHWGVNVGLAGLVAGLVVLTGVVFGLPMWLGTRALAKMEF